jgi:hypothetical protein
MCGKTRLAFEERPLGTLLAAASNNVILVSLESRLASERCHVMHECRTASIQTVTTDLSISDVSFGTAGLGL